MVFWQLTIDANDPLGWRGSGRKARLPAAAAGRASNDLARALPGPAGADAAFDDRLFDPAGLGLPQTGLRARS
jgi:hypothetical protein